MPNVQLPSDVLHPVPIASVTPTRFDQLLANSLLNPPLVSSLLAARLTENRNDIQLAPDIAIALKRGIRQSNGQLLIETTQRVAHLGRYQVLIAVAYLLGPRCGDAVLKTLWVPEHIPQLLRVFVAAPRAQGPQGGVQPQFLSFSVSGAWDAVSDAVTSAAGAVVGIIQTVADAAGDFIHKLSELGGDLVQAFSTIVTESIEFLAEVVDKLMETGKTVNEILSAALAVSSDMLGKMVEALAKARTEALSALDWVAGNAGCLGIVILALARAAITPLVILEYSLRIALDVTKVTQYLLERAHSLMLYFQQLNGAVAETLKATMKSLFDLGYSLIDIIGELARAEFQYLSRGRFLDALIALGYAALDILKAAATFGAVQLAITFASLLSLWQGRRLTPKELYEAVRIYGFWPQLLNVWVINHAIASDIVGFFDNDRPITMMATLVFPGQITNKALIHELMHVHQNYISGSIYIVKSVEEQLRSGQGAYEVDVHDHKKLEQFGIEQQAQLVENYYSLRFETGQPENAWEDYLPVLQGLAVPPPTRATGAFQKWAERCPQALVDCNLLSEGHANGGYGDIFGHHPT